MATEYEKLVIKLETDTSAYDRGLKGARKSGQGFASDIEKIGDEADASAKRGEGAFSRFGQAISKARAEIGKGGDFEVGVDDSALTGLVAKIRKAKAAISGKATVEVDSDGAATTIAALNRVDETADKVDGRKVGLVIGGAATVAGAVATGAALKSLGSNMDLLSGTATRLAAQKMPLMMAAFGAAPAVISGVGVPTLALAQALGQGAAGFAAIGGAAAAGAGGLTAYKGAATLAVQGALDVRNNMLSASQAVATADDAVRSAEEALRSAKPGTAEYAAAQRDLALATEAAAKAQRDFQRLQILNTPAAQAFSAELDKQTMALTRVQAELGNRVLPGFTRMMQMGREQLPALTPPLYRLAESVTGVGESFVQAQLSGSRFGRLQEILGFVSRSGTLAAMSISRMADSGLGIAQSLIPAAGRLEVRFLGLTDATNDWISSTEGANRISSIISTLETRMYQLGGIVVDVGAGLMGVFSAINESGIGDELLSDVQGLASGFSHVGEEGSSSRDAIVSFANDSLPLFRSVAGVAGELLDKFFSMSREIITFRDEGQKTTVLVDIFDSLRDAVGPVSDMMVGAFKGIGPELPELIDNLADLVATFAGTTPVLETYLGGMNDVLHVFNALPDPVKDTVAGMVALGAIASGGGGGGLIGVAGAIGSIYFQFRVLKALGAPSLIASLAGGVAWLGTSLWGAATAAWAFIAPWLAAAAPFVIAGAAIVGIGAAMIYAYKHSETFRKGVDWLVSGFNDADGASILWAGSLKSVREEMEKHPENFSPIERGLLDLRTAFATGGKEGSTFSRRLQGVWEQLTKPPDFGPTVDVINSVRDALYLGDESKKKPLGEALKGIWREITEPPDYGPAVKVIGSIWDALTVSPKEIKNAGRGLGERLSGLWKQLTAPPDFGPAAELIDTVWDALTPGKEGDQKTLGERLSGLWKQITAPPDFGPAIEVINSIWSALTPGRKGDQKSLGERLSGLWKQITEPPDYGPAAEVIGSIWTALTGGGEKKKGEGKTLGERLSGLWKQLTEPPDFGPAIEVISTVWSALSGSSAGDKKGDQKQKTLGERLSGLWSQLTKPPDAGAALEVMGSVWSALFPPKEGEEKSLGERLSGLWSEISKPPDFGPAVEVLDTIGENARDMWSDLTKPPDFGPAKDAVAGLKESVVKNVSEAASQALAKGTEIKEGLAARFGETKTNAGEAWTNIRETVSGRMSEAKENGIARAKELGSGAITTFENLRDGTGPIFGVTRDRIVNPIQDAKEGTIGFLNDIIEAVNSVLTKVGLKPIGTMDTGSSGSGSPPPNSGQQRQKNFARGGVTGYETGGMGTGSSQPRVHVWNEQQGNEAFIAEKRPAREQLPYLQTAADWHGYALVPSNPEKSGVSAGFAEGGIALRAFEGGGIGAMYEAVKSKFGVEGFNEHTYLSFPASRDSLDFMVTTPGTRAEGADKGLGDNIAAYVAPPSTVTTIWYGMADFGSGWQPYNGTTGVGNANTLGHYDHVHAQAFPDQFKGAQGTYPGPGGGGGMGVSVPNPKQVLFEKLWGATVKPLVNAFLSPLDDASYVALNAVGAAARKVPEGIYKWIDDQIADTVGGSGSPSGPYKGGGDLRDWAENGLVLGNVFPASDENIQKIMARAQQESGGDPNAVNDWDSNAAAGTPSKGLMQIIEPTWNGNTTSQIGNFDSNWNDPVKSVAVASRYMKSAYGYVVGATGQGYSAGGIIPGADGESVLIQAHAGERVLPREVVSSFDRLATSVSLWSSRKNAAPGAEMGLRSAREAEDMTRELRAIREKLDDVGLSRPSRDSIERGARRVAGEEIHGESGRRSYESHSSRSERSYSMRGGY